MASVGVDFQAGPMVVLTCQIRSNLMQYLDEKLENSKGKVRGPCTYSSSHTKM